MAWVRSLLMAFVLATAMPGCEGVELYESCPMTDRMVDDCDSVLLSGQCQEFGATCYVSCAVQQHPQCFSGEGACLIFQYQHTGDTENSYKSPSFCSFACSVDEDCGENAKCLPFLDTSYCVPNRYSGQNS